VALAGQLYHTLHDRILKLPDSVQVLPTHGAGSFCAAPVSKDRVSTIGRERATNPMLQPQREEEFVRRALSGLPSYPVYFKEMRAVNQAGPRVFRGLPKVPGWTPAQLRDWAESGGAVVDVRSADAFAQGHIVGAYSIGTDVWVETWVGWLIPFGTPLAFVADTTDELDDAVRQVFRIGYDDLRGHLQGGMAAWRAAGLPVETVPEITAAELHQRLASPDAPLILDVRFAGEWRKGHIPAAVHLENGRLAWDDLQIPKDRAIAVHCATGGRSMTGLSVLARRGYRHLAQVRGGFRDWRDKGFEVAEGP
jgi:hydroxyacylglutathione hydrolase